MHQTSYLLHVQEAHPCFIPFHGIFISKDSGDKLTFSKYFIIRQKILLGVPIVMKCLLVFKYSSQVLHRFCSTQLLYLFLRWYGSQTHKEKFGYRKLKTHKKKITTRQTFLLLSLFTTVCLLQLSIIYWTATSTSAPSLTTFFFQ